MPPLRDYQCRECSHVWEEFIQTKEDIPDACVQCDSAKVDPLPGAHGGYRIRGSNSASTTPRGTGSFKKGNG